MGLEVPVGQMDQERDSGVSQSKGISGTGEHVDMDEKGEGERRAWGLDLG